MSNKKKTFLKKKTTSGEVSLQITSMADIFMILLVFLLKNYSATLTNISPSSELSLPEIAVSAKSTPKESLRIEVGPEAILVDQEFALKLKNFEFPEKEMESSGSPTIAQFMKKQRELRPPNTEASVVVMADQRAPYSTIKRVIASAAGAGFVELQLVVVDPQ